MQRLSNISNLWNRLERFPQFISIDSGYISDTKHVETTPWTIEVLSAMLWSILLSWIAPYYHSDYYNSRFPGELLVLVNLRTHQKMPTRVLWHDIDISFMYNGGPFASSHQQPSIVRLLLCLATTLRLLSQCLSNKVSWNERPNGWHKTPWWRACWVLLIKSSKDNNYHSIQKQLLMIYYYYFV